MYWKESGTPNQWVAYPSESKQRLLISIRLACTDGNWSCRLRGTASPWTDITADSLEEAQAVAETLFKMGAL